MMTEHVGDDILVAYADDPAAYSEVDAHLASCAECSSAVAFYRTLTAELRDGEVWAAEEEVRSGRGQEIIRGFAERIAAEDTEAKELLRHVIDSPYHFAKANIVVKSRFHTGGVVRVLCEAVRAECDENEPKYARQLAQAAQLIAESLPDDYYPASAVFELRGRAWKEFATTCHYLGQFQNGLDALRRAERAYQHLPDPGLGLAAVNLSRAILHWNLRRYHEALSFADLAAREYEIRRLITRFVEAKEVKAVILQRMGDPSAAQEIYKQVFNAATELDDAEMLARSAGNLGINYRDSGDLGNASKYLLMALQLFEGLGHEVRVARTRWSIARLLLTAGNFRDAEVRLRAACGELEAKGLQGDLADAKLDLAETLLMLGALDEVESLCADVTHFYRQAKIVTGALSAVTFLKEAAAKRAITREHIKRVRAYLVELQDDPRIPFDRPAVLP